MKVIIFIGHHKTGSASLQEFLSQNALGLMRAGILYPAVEAQGMSLLLSRAMNGRDRVETLPFNMREAHNALAFRMLADVTGGKIPPVHPGLPDTDTMLRTIEHQILALQPGTIVLASEVMGHYSRVSPLLIRRLAGFFEGADIRIIANLRRVDDHMASWHGQRIRLGEKVNTLSNVGMAPYRKGIHFDYRTLLSGWKTEMPEAKIILRNYGDVLAAGGSVVDFIKQSGQSFPKKLLPVRHANRGLHRGLYEIARRANQRLRPLLANEMFRLLLNLAPKLDLPDTKDIELYSGDMRGRIAAAFEPVHDWLGEHSGQAPFFPDIDEIKTSRPYDGHEVARDALAQLRELHGHIPNPDLRVFLDGLELNR